jgi:hypothetical protein
MAGEHAQDSSGQLAQVGRVIKNSAIGVPGIGVEATVRIDGESFRVDLNRPGVHNNLLLTGKLHGTRATGNAFFSAVVGREVGTFDAARI